MYRALWVYYGESSRITHIVEALNRPARITRASTIESTAPADYIILAVVILYDENIFSTARYNNDGCTTR